MGPVEAMRATGANLFQVMVFGVFPQVRVGVHRHRHLHLGRRVSRRHRGGVRRRRGHGWYLKRAVLQIQTERVAAIILSIVVLVLVSEVVSAYARNRVMKMK